LAGRADLGGWVETGAPGDHEDFVMDTDGTVLLRSEICMCVNPLPGLRTHVCIALDPGVGGADSIAVTDSSIKSHHPVGKPFTI
jgi:hypothetical protein